MMTVDTVAVRGQSTWWVWVISDKGVVVEESITQFRSATAAESDGQARLAGLKRQTVTYARFQGGRPTTTPAP